LKSIYYTESESEEDEEPKPLVKGRDNEEESEEVGLVSIAFVFYLRKYIQSSEYETDSEEEKPNVQFRPVFVPKYV
jgi:hypothetical protein